jgi:hypothetical protein
MRVPMNARAVYAGIGVLTVAIIALTVFTILRSNDLSSRISDLDETATTLQEEASGESKAALENQEGKLKLRFARTADPASSGRALRGRSSGRSARPIFYPPEGGQSRMRTTPSAGALF